MTEYLSLVKDEQSIRVVRPESVVARTAGMLKNDIPVATPEEERQAAEQAVAEEASRRIGE